MQNQKGWEEVLRHQEDQSQHPMRPDKENEACLILSTDYDAPDAANKTGSSWLISHVHILNVYHTQIYTSIYTYIYTHIV